MDPISNQPPTTTGDEDVGKLADRLHALSARLRAHAASRPAYEPPSCESCIAACRNFVRLTYGLPEFRGNTPNASSSHAQYARSSTPETDDPLWAAWNGDLQGATRGMWELVTMRVTGSAAVYDYKMCLADCIDDQALQYSAAVTDCVARAKSEAELAKCTERLTRDAAEFRKLEREARRLEAKLNRIHPE
ncbi:hypothetical protein H9P43_003585 [Blastocladiella emersonii ATCC 22665]|nr:hypothetical protein H9P43_003585 [Blastocladiella emersonii ATCC 22665]